MEVPFNNSTGKNSEDVSPPTGEGVVMDIGTGDGRFAYRTARENPNRFFIGIDANAKPLEKISMKATRKIQKGGAPNLLFVQAAIEDLPEEFDSAADEVHIHFPWGSLLQTVLAGEATVLQSLRRVCAPEALLEIIVGIDPERDRSEIERLGLADLSSEYLANSLIPKYESAGFEMIESGLLDSHEWARLETSWARKLRGNEGRRVIFLIFRAV